MSQRAALCAALVWAGAALLWGGAAQAQAVTAILEPAESVEIRTKVPGHLLSVEVREGAEVDKGAPLAAIESGTQRKRVALARAVAEADGRVQRAQAQIAQAETLLARLETAQSRGAAQSWEVEQAEQAVALAQADRQIAHDGQQQALAQLALEEAILEDYTLRAPFSGVVLEVQQTAGAHVDVQTAILSLAQLDTLEATAFVPLAWLDRVAVGQSLAAEVEGAAIQTAAIVITAIDPRIDPASRTVRIRVTLDNADGAYRPGATLVLQSP